MGRGRQTCDLGARNRRLRIDRGLALNPDRRLVSAGAVLAFCEVAAGAFGAHGLRDRISPESLAVWETAVRYGTVHALGAILSGVLRVPRAGWCFLAGAVVFSGTLHALALGAPRAIGMATPIGGVLFLAGWILLAASSRSSSPP